MKNSQLLIVHHSMDMDGLFSGIYADKMLGNSDNILASFDYYDNEKELDKMILDNDIENVLFIDVTPSIDWFKNNINKLNLTIIDHHFEKLKQIVKEVIDSEIELYEPSTNDDLETFYVNKLDIIYSNNSATKTLEMTFLDDSLPLLFERKEFKLTKTDSQIIDLVDMYDVWKWEEMVIKNVHQINPNFNYNLYHLAMDYVNIGDSVINKDVDLALEAYMFNYALNKYFKQIRTLNPTLIQLADLKVKQKYKLRNIGERNTSVFMEILYYRLIYNNGSNLKNLRAIIIDGFLEYIKDYEEVKQFFEMHPNINSIVEEVNFNGFNYVICNYKFSNIIRDYFYNNIENLHFIVFPRFETLDKFKVTGRTIQQNSFNMGKLMKDVYNGGGHFNAGGGTIKGDKIDIEKINHRELINKFIIDNY